MQEFLTALLSAGPTGIVLFFALAVFWFLKDKIVLASATREEGGGAQRTLERERYSNLINVYNTNTDRLIEAVDRLGERIEARLDTDELVRNKEFTVMGQQIATEIVKALR